MVYSYTGMPTPPRRLPTLSPSSARLRRLAPSPVKVVPITPLILTPPRFQDSFYDDPTTCTTKDEAPRQSLDDPFEYDFTPLEKVVIMSSDARGGGEERRYFESPKRTNRNASTDSNASVPLIFDSRGDFGVLAEKHRRLMTSRRGSTTGLEPDVPEEEEVDEFMAPASGPASGSRERVVFRDDVFSSSSPVAQTTAADLPSFESDTTISSLKRSEPMTRLGQLEREDSIPESNYTFGRPSTSSALEDRRPSVSSMEDDDGWSYTLSAYGDEDDLAAARRMSILSDRPPGSFDQLDAPSSHISSAPTTSAPQIHPYAAASKVHRTSTSAWSDSTASTRTELFTPDYTVAPLPTHCHGKSPFDDSAESPTSTRLRSTIPLPPSPRSGSSLGLVVGQDASGEKIDNTPKQTRTLRHSLLPKSPLPAEPIGETPTAHSAKHLNVQVSDKRKSSAGSSSTTSTTSYPEHIVNALKAIDKSTTLSLYVDQEGTREVQTTLKYMKMHKPQVFRNREMKSLEEAALWCESPTRPEPFQQTGCIEFGMDPKARAKWNFHHAALEGLPVLRRLTLSGDEKHDYLSRGATLQIRDTGVYAVFGHEDKGRIEWKFEYLVQPRISASTGEVVPNEKIIIPLGFYVSPNFFNPDRALKLHLLNVFKKQLTPNLVAEKVKPPHIGTPPAQPSLQPSRPATAQPTAVPPIGGSGGSGGSGAMSRTLNTIAKAVTGSRTSTPLSMDKDIPPFGSKTPLLRTHPSKGSEDYSTQVATPDSVKSDKKGARKRATSLFSRSRPFTPPVNTDLHPVPKLTTNPGMATPPLASKKSAMSLRQRPHTAQGPVPPIPPAVIGTMAGSPLGQLAPTPSKVPTSRTLVPMQSTPSLKQPRYRPHTSDASPMPFASHPTYTASMTPDSALLAYSVRHSLGASNTALSASAGSEKAHRSPHPFSTHVTVRRPSTAGGGTGDGNPKLFGHLRTGSTSRKLNPLTARDPNVLHRADVGAGYGQGGSNDAVKGSRVVIGHNDHMVRYNPHGGSALTPPPRSDSAESLKVPSWQGQKGGMKSADGGGGLSPAPRPRPALRKRPSTADPRS